MEGSELMGTGCWSLSSHQATLRTPQLTGSLDLSRPGLGLRQLKFGSASWSDSHLLAVQWGDDAANTARTLSDCYVRGGDLIATYAEEPQRPYAPQVYWRAIGIGGIEAGTNAGEKKRGAYAPRSPVVAQLELLVSVQTPLLDAQPEMTANSRIPAVEVFHLRDSESGSFSPLEMGAAQTIDADSTTGCLLLRLADGRQSYVEMVHPLDFVQGRLSVDATADGVLLSHTLIDCRMEKGVIIRTRLRGCFVDRADDMAATMRLFEEFAGSALPLSA
ncbi:MAG: hypothetical protein K8T91_19475 [Planctomycetes bacterium]|nr:hypothetical protein [Planctomycetota bacterium]